jgi:DNA-binding MarR family transcriptional regulator
MQDSIGYGIKKLHLATRQLLDHTLAPYGLSQAQAEIIYYLLQQDSQTQADLGRKLKVAAPTVTKLIDGLIEKGFVERRGDAADARRKQVSLTEQGRQFQQQIKHAQQKTEAVLRESFTAEEVALLHDFIRRMYQNVSRKDQA